MRKILIVDDDPNIALLIQMTLTKKSSYETEIAHSGEQALAMIENASPDLVLLDIMMPGIDGFEVCRRIKENEKTRLIPVIMITAKREMGDKVHGMGVGANDYITKPFNPEELLARVQAQLRIRELEKENAAKKELEAVLKMSISLQHEINNPLTGVIGNLELLREREEMTDDEVDQAIEEVLSLALRIKDIIRQMGRISRVVSSRYIEGSEMIDIGKSAEDTL